MKLTPPLPVQVCTSSKAVKYLYKYTYKGPDKACIRRADWVDGYSLANMFTHNRKC